MTNQAIADILDDIGTLLELKGENPFKSRAYHNAARTIRDYNGDVARHAADATLETLKGIGKGLAGEITEIVTTGRSASLESLQQSLPAGLMQLLRLPGLGPKKTKLMYDTLKISSIEDLKKALGSHALASIPGFGEKSEENLTKSIAHLEQHAEHYLFAEVETIANRLAALIRKEPYVMQCETAGSLRRKKEIIGDIDILASVKKGSAGKLMKLFVSNDEVKEVVARGATKSTVILPGTGIRCDLRVVGKAEFPYALAYFTGSKDHNVAMRSLAKQKGWSLNEYGFTPLAGKKRAVPACKDETDIYAALGLAYVPPELREQLGEIEAAREGTLPELLSDDDLRGTFHCHTTYSDGKNTLQEMARAAASLGWEYLGIADHSKVAVYAGGLTEARVRQQQKEIDRLNAASPSFRLFKGTEVDILSDGTLDWSDNVLSTFDYVVASIHSKFKMTEQEATKRIISALKNKYVNILGHPTGRLLLEREGYPVNLKEVIQAAADYGKIIEINAHPVRLDLDWRMVRYAKEKGVPIAINPDAHTVEGLKDVRYGVAVARKGWLTRQDVVNTRRLKEVVKLFQQPSQRT
jgi:DNA polymerase (family 10)